ncbi:PDR/VanB family oxidoreductase [Marinobacterium iners]|uniref:Vanillate O-demethylase ferredoxin subunit n=1 Tax=Marinobacterium iners DSM 11526 TaxID=1122198 RepID=A0A1H4DAL2_9GAMM|nr:PDR/VanB family oxidoreductase [Marinobacterium iners]SEA69322.1 vanillate O-demethylase ferredoxin subunit [Marinobacterium iners DSM 11526]
MTTEATIIKKETIADNIVHLVLEDCRGKGFAPFEPGAHIDLHIDDKTIRQYSLINSLDGGHTYEIAILREANGRGGSIKVHDTLQPGDKVKVGPPRNAFPLQRSDFSVLIAGGIGITPIISMADYLEHQGQPFTLHYCTRSAKAAALRDRIESSTYADRTRFYFDDQAMRFDPTALEIDIPDKRLYVCGPQGFIEFIKRSAEEAGWPKERIHYESFQKAEGGKTGHGKAFTLIIDGTGDQVEVAADETALEALERKGYEIPCSCEQGICGTCILDVIAGIPDHHDAFFTDKERLENLRFTPCCSRALTPSLTVKL